MEKVLIDTDLFSDDTFCWAICGFLQTSWVIFIFKSFDLMRLDFIENNDNLSIVHIPGIFTKLVL